MQSEGGYEVRHFILIIKNSLEQENVALRVGKAKG